MILEARGQNLDRWNLLRISTQVARSIYNHFGAIHFWNVRPSRTLDENH